MKNILLIAYIKENLGDDLFVKMLVEKYPMYNFFMRLQSSKYIGKLADLPNLEISIVDDLNDKLYSSNVQDFDAYIYIGGSIFMETGTVYKHSEEFYQFIQKCKKNNRPFYYISCNYGPYMTQEYFNYSQKIFADCKDVCFRDIASYNMFKELPSIRYAPDFAFNYIPNQIEKKPNSIGISVIDLLPRKDLKNKHEQYINSLITNIKNYIATDKTVYLYSFCKFEGDENTMNSILEKFSNHPNIVPIRYDGDIDKFLNTYSKMEYFICTRFHSAILSCIFKQKIQILSYSKKINNVINDLKFQLPITDISNISDSTNFNLSDFRVVDDIKLKNAIQEAKHQVDGINSLG